MLENSYYRISIAGAGFTGAAPADGFIDNRTMAQYASSSVLANGGTGYRVGDVLTTSATSPDIGTRYIVQSVADNGAILSTTEVPGTYATFPSGNQGVTYVTAPVAPLTAGTGGLFDLPNYPPDLAHSLARARANVRFSGILDQIQLMANCFVCDTFATGANFNTIPTAFDFTIFFERDSQVQTRDELNPGVSLIGSAAVHRCVARALMVSKTTLREVYDPTLANAEYPSGSQTALFPNSPAPVGGTVTNIVAGPLVPSTGNLVTDLGTAAGAVTVTRTPNVDLAF